MSAPATAEPICLIWSNEHRLWRGPDDEDYTGRLSRAGRYPLGVALRICRQAILVSGHRLAALPEIPVRLDDVLALRDHLVITRGTPPEFLT